MIGQSQSEEVAHFEHEHLATGIAADVLNLTAGLRTGLNNTDVGVILDVDHIGHILHATARQLFLGIEAAVIFAGHHARDIPAAGELISPCSRERSSQSSSASFITWAEGAKIDKLPYDKLLAAFMSCCSDYTCNMYSNEMFKQVSSMVDDVHERIVNEGGYNEAAVVVPSN